MQNQAEVVRPPSPSIQLHCNACALARSCLPAAVLPRELELLQTLIRHTRPLLARTHVFRAGEPFAGAYVVRTGVVKSYRTAADGQEQTVGFHFPGEFFGLEGLGQATHATSAMVLESAALCALPIEKVFAEAALPATQAHLFHLMAERIGAQQEHMILLSHHTAEERVAAFLLGLSQRFRRCRMSGTWMRVPMSRGEISNYLGLVIETVSRVLMRFQRLGLIRLANRDLELLDVAQLHAVARLPFAAAVADAALPVRRVRLIESSFQPALYNKPSRATA